ncbi:unnamed protein product [Parnassius apollo]|uniref:(apollo) hypothetical protein n=1 Tax=Parnassius apollo TaxID=110799 RepID=A0A8S3Y0U8_PARAO|nr:unnamed protein product [Parnassius apollo]
MDSKTIDQPQVKSDDTSKVHKSKTESNVTNATTIINDTLIDQITTNDNILKAIIRALVAMGNSGRKLTTSCIKEMPITDLKNNKINNLFEFHNRISRKPQRGPLDGRCGESECEYYAHGPRHHNAGGRS